MTYSTHRILETGHIELRELDNGVFHRSVIAPNQVLDKYKTLIKKDENWVAYRTQANADAYELAIAESIPSETEQLEHWRATEVVDLYKLKIVLDNMGDLDTIETIISSQPKGVQLAWQNANTVRRDSKTVAGLAQVMGYSDTQLDTIFKNAKQVQL